MAHVKTAVIKILSLSAKYSHQIGTSLTTISVWPKYEFNESEYPFLIIKPTSVLSSKIENAHFTGKNNHNVKCGIRETATTRNFALWKLQ